MMRSRQIRVTVICAALVLISLPCNAFDKFLSASIDRVTYTYQKAVKTLEPLGFSGPFAHEVTKYAVLRQVVEDGVDRSHNYSIVGMIPAGVNKEVVNFLKTHDKTKGFKKIRVSSTKDKKGQGCYVFQGEDASVWSSVAIVLVWDGYVNKNFVKKPELRKAWTTTKLVSRAQYQSPEIIKKALKNEERNFKSCLKTVNRIYGPKHKLIEKSAEKL